jgi:hypothetical protein
MTFATKLNVPAVVGVPEIDPVCESESPGGRAPLSMSHVNSGLPPIAASVRLYATPVVASGKSVVPIESTEGVDGVITGASFV